MQQGADARNRSPRQKVPLDDDFRAPNLVCALTVKFQIVLCKKFLKILKSPLSVYQRWGADAHYLGPKPKVLLGDGFTPPNLVCALRPRPEIILCKKFGKKLKSHVSAYYRWGPTPGLVALS